VLVPPRLVQLRRFHGRQREGAGLQDALGLRSSRGPWPAWMFR
jgi:hypothetical protein